MTTPRRRGPVDRPGVPRMLGGRWPPLGGRGRPARWAGVGVPRKLALPKKNCQGGCRRHKLHIPRLVAADCISLEDASGAFELIPSQLLFPVQTLRWFAPGALSLWAPAHSFRCSSSSHRKRCAYFAVGALYFPPDDPLKTPKGRGPRPPPLESHPLGWVGEGADAGDGGPCGRFAAHGAWKGNPINQRAEVVILPASLSAPLASLALAGWGRGMVLLSFYFLSLRGAERRGDPFF